jgi:hypothetical protein
VFEDHEYNTSFDDPPIDHAAYTDPSKLDRSEAKAILSPYPKLWAYLQSEMDRPDAYEQYCSGGIHRMHDGRYLRDVVRQHLWLIEGPGDGVMFPEPARAVFAERIATLLAEAPPSYVEMRHEWLNSPWKRALMRHYIRLYNLPDYVERNVKRWWRQLEPDYVFSAEYLTRQRVLNAMFNASVDVREAGSGKLVAKAGEPANHPSRRTASSN